MTSIALVLSGSASLGSYTAGAVVELLGALESTGERGPKVRVVTGSGAGGLSAALAARSLVVNPALVPWIERTWLEGLDARLLLDPGGSDPRGLLDAGGLDEMMRHLVAGPPADDDRPGRAMGEALRVGLSLTDLDGSVRTRPLGERDRRPRGYGIRRHDDAFVRRLERGASARDPAWDDLRRAAVAAATPPFLLPPRELLRRATEGPPADEAQATGAGADLKRSYGGDGMGAERPLTLARRLAREDGFLSGRDWRFVVVNPHLVDDPEDAGEAAGEEPPPRSAGQVAARSLRAALGRGAAREWERANDANARVEILRRLVGRLPEIGDRIVDPEAVGVGRHVGELAERVAEWEVARRPGESRSADPVVDRLDRGLERVQSDPAYAAAFDRIEGRAARSRVAKLVYVLEAVGGLHDHELLPLRLVAPRRPGELVGARLGGFGGFLSRRWREHDFRAGRRDAHRLLAGPLSDVVRYEPAGPKAYEPGEVEEGFDRLPPATLDRLRAALEARAETHLRSLRPGGLAGMLYGAVRPALGRAWAERALADLRGGP